MPNMSKQDQARALVTGILNTVPVNSQSPVFVQADNPVMLIEDLLIEQPIGKVYASELIGERIGRMRVTYSAATVAIVRCKPGAVFPGPSEFRKYAEDLQESIQLQMAQLRVLKTVLNVALDPEEFQQKGIMTAQLTVESAW